jgi:hypothetical protein
MKAITKNMVNPARHSTVSVRSLRSRWNVDSQSSGSAGPCISLVTGEIVERRGCDMANIDWRRAKKLDTSEPGYKQQRLDRAADNWLDHGSLNRKPPAKENAKTGRSKSKGSKRG